MLSSLLESSERLLVKKARLVEKNCLLVLKDGERHYAIRESRAPNDGKESTLLLKELLREVEKIKLRLINS